MSDFTEAKLLLPARPLDRGRDELGADVALGNGLATENIHPNDNIGYPWMGDPWYTAIKPYLH